MLNFNRNSILTTVGNDPEFFLLSKRGTPIAAEKILPPKYSNPTPEIYFDNVAVEFDAGPSQCLQEHNNRLSELISKFADILKHNNIDLFENRVSFAAAQEISKITLDKYDSTKQFACNPSLVLKNEEIEPSYPTVNPYEVLKRSAGFHIHVGKCYETHQIQDKFIVNFIKLCDLLVGLPAVFLEKDTEKVLWRRKILGYGLAGEFRIQPHGYEYRTLGAWPLSHPLWVWWANASVRLCRVIAKHITLNDTPLSILSIDRNAVINTINNNIFSDAKAIWKDVKIALQKDFEIKNVTEHDNSGTFLSNNNTAAFEFIISQLGGLELTNKKFWSSWLQPVPKVMHQSIYYNSAYWGMQSTRYNLLNSLGFVTYLKSYKFDHDNL